MNQIQIDPPVLCTQCWKLLRHDRELDVYEHEWREENPAMDLGRECPNKGKRWKITFEAKVEELSQ